MEHFEFERIAPTAGLDRFVDQFWRTSWNLDQPFTQHIVTFPVVNLVVQADGSAMLSGPRTSNDERLLRGSGWAFGAMFRPGGFRPLFTRSMSDLVDVRIPAEQLFGHAIEVLAEEVVRAADSQDRVQRFSAFLLERFPDTPTIGEELSEVIEAAVTQVPPVTRVAELASMQGVSVRTLQRLFAEHVGIGPKQVLNRYRVQAAGELARTPAESWSAMAHRLGYSDQAHLTADLTETFGAPPATYSRLENPEP